MTRTLHLSDSSELPLRLRGIARSAGRVRGLARGHRRRTHGPRRREVHDGRRARHADGVGAAEERPGHLGRFAPTLNLDGGERMVLAHEMRGNMSLAGFPTRQPTSAPTTC